MDVKGVRNLAWTDFSNPGRRLSLLIAKGNREAERTPAFAIDIRANTAINARIIFPTGPKIFSADVATGVLSFIKASSGIVPMRTKTTRL